MLLVHFALRTNPVLCTGSQLSSLKNTPITTSALSSHRLLISMAISQMAISASSTSISALTTDCSKSVSTFSTTKLSSFTSLKQSGQLQRIRIQSRVSISSAPRRGVLTLVKAEKQTFSNLDELLENADKPILVDFYATWCGPCQFMNPILNEVGASLKDKVQVVKIDTEKYPSIASKYQIEALPTFIIFKDGKPCDRFEGALTAKQLIQRIENALKVKQ